MVIQKYISRKDFFYEKNNTVVKYILENYDIKNYNNTINALYVKNKINIFQFDIP